MTTEEKIRFDKISRYLRLDDGAPFLDELHQRRNRVYGSLKGASEIITIGRYQGQLEILDWIITTLREES